MKYRITMKDGTQYIDEQHLGFVGEMGHKMAETDFNHCHLAADGSFVIRCSEIASLERVEIQEDAA